MFRIAVPILGVASSEDAEAFYCGKLGFRKIYAYRPDPEKVDPCYMGIQRDDAHIVVSSFPGDGPPGTRGVQIYVDDVKAVYSEFKQNGAPVDGDIQDQDWGNLEIGLQDPDGNGLTISQSKDV